MAYRAQMVIRTKDADAAKVLDTVKKLAESRGQTISELAIEFFEAGINSEGGAATEDTDEAAAEPEPQADIEKATIVVPEPVQHVRSPEAKVRPPRELIEDEAETHGFAQQAVRLVVTEGAGAGAEYLKAFFQKANPGHAGHLRELLQEQLRDKEFDELFDLLRETDEYREYRQRLSYCGRIQNVLEQQR